MIKELTKEQEDMLAAYRDKGIEIGMSTDPFLSIDMEKTKELTQLHREKCGAPRAQEIFVYDSPFAAIEDKKWCNKLNAYNALYGQYDINWLMYYKFFQVECGVKNLESINHLYSLASMCGWMWMCTPFTIITRKPTEMHTIRKKREDEIRPFLDVLHNTEDMALKYNDGKGVFCLWGVRIPLDLGEKFILPKDKENLNVDEIFKVRNTEIRTSLIKLVGIDKCLSKLDSKVLDRKVLSAGGEYILHEVTIGESPRRYLEMACPSDGRKAFESVHPDCNTVEEANSWANCGQMGVDMLPSIIT